MLARIHTSSLPIVSDVQSQVKIKAMAIIATTLSSHLNRAVISLDGILVGNVTEEESNNMFVTASNTGHKFIIPSCKVFSVDKTNANNVIIDLAYREVVKYRIP